MIQQVIKTIRTLPTTSSVTKQETEQAVDLALMMPIYKNLDRNYLIREVESLYNIRTGRFPNIRRWRKADLDWQCKSKYHMELWNRYRDYLQIEKTILTRAQIKLTNSQIEHLTALPTEKNHSWQKGFSCRTFNQGKTSKLIQINL